MAESILDVRGLAKPDAYAAVADTIEQLLEGTTDRVTAMATISAVLHHGFGFLWTGFYRVVSPALLRVGPYQGTVGCLEITVGRGVCGTAAAERRSVVVPDVDAFPGHITCDARSRSEIVVPVFDHEDNLIAVLDVDSEQASTFDADDQRGLERIVTWFARADATD